MTDQLCAALLEVEDALAKDAFAKHEWLIRRRKECAMWRYVLKNAPEDIQATAAHQIALYFHPKADLPLEELQGRVEELALALIEKLEK